MPQEPVSEGATHPATGLPPISTSQNRHPEEIRKVKIDLDQLGFSLYEKFESNPSEAADFLYEFLLDEEAVRTRVLILEAYLESDIGVELFPVRQVDDTAKFVRELYWISAGLLKRGIELDPLGSLRRLSLLFSNPAALKLAHQAAKEGTKAVMPLISRLQAEAWQWLHKETTTGRLQQQLKSEVEEKYVAVWRVADSNNELAEVMEIHSDSEVARKRVADRFLVPDSLIAELFVTAG